MGHSAGGGVMTTIRQTAMPLSLGISSRLLVGGALAVPAAMVGLLAGREPELAVAAVLGLAFVTLVFVSFPVGLCLFTLVTFLEALPASGGVSFSKVAGGLLVLSWLASAVAHRANPARRDLLGLHPGFASLLAAFVGWAAISMLWAESTDAATTDVLRFALNIALFPIVFAALRLPRHVVWLFVFFVAGALISAGYGVVTGEAGELRLEGAGLNPNQLGGLLAVGTILAVALALSGRGRWFGSAAALLAAAGCAAGLFTTVSRGALLGLGVALLATPFVAGRGRRTGALVLIALTACWAVTWFATIAPSDAVDRITRSESSGSGRSDLWKIGWRMVEDHPLRGVGVGNFPVSSIDYLLVPGTLMRPDLIVDRPQVAHNIYLHVASELGLVGITLFVAILLYSLYSALIAARVFALRGDHSMEILARGLLLALIGLLAADFFSSQLYSKQLWLLLAAAPALRAIAERGGDAEPE